MRFPGTWCRIVADVIPLTEDGKGFFILTDAMSYRNLPCSDDRGERIFFLFAGFFFAGWAGMLLYDLIFSGSWHLLLFLLPAVGVSSFCFIGFVIRWWERKDFLKNTWNEKKVRKIMREEDLLSLSQTVWMEKMPPVPRPVSFSIWILFLFSLLPLNHWYEDFTSMRGRRWKVMGGRLYFSDLPIPWGQCEFLLFFYIAIFFILYATFQVCSNCPVQYPVWKAVVSVVFLSILLVLWLCSFAKGWRTIQLLRYGVLAPGIIREHWMTGRFYLYLDVSGNSCWSASLPANHSGKKNQKVTVIFNVHAPEKSRILDDLINEKQIEIDEHGRIGLPRCRIAPVILTLLCFVSFVALVIFL
ncbi:MAG: hypothetical protein J6J31_02680 [Thermoguttaceae bacterium]|nr:hypothetical protein [Thermoguttaceae bacterium]